MYGSETLNIKNRPLGQRTKNLKKLNAPQHLELLLVHGSPSKTSRSCFSILKQTKNKAKSFPLSRYLTNHEDWRFSERFDLSGEDEIAVYVR